MDFMIQQSLKLIESGKIPDQAIRAAIRALSKKRLTQEGRYDPELVFTSCRAMMVRLPPSRVLRAAAKNFRARVRPPATKPLGSSRAV